MTTVVCKKPVIVLGNQKSGTTAIASLLADYGQLSKTLDIPELWEKDPEIHSGKLSLSSFVKATSHRFSSQLLKEPLLTFFFKELAELFPSSRYLFVIRHPAENIRSILDRLGIPGNLKHVETKNYTDNRPWMCVIDGLTLNIKCEHYISRLAMRWVIASEVYLKNKENMLLMRYEDFVQDKYESIQRIARSLRIKKKQNIDGLLNIQYQLKGVNSGTSWTEFYGEKNLSAIKKICEPYLKHFGYDM